ncbi:FMN-binding glutamate synthase family protein [Vampirovibrio sp.]|uniref:FMN-binding glutamate synthase family protein n=1 Tax=Vampirovibrio sp. TaxID=2717857 RepID=UPI0035938768
MFGHLPIRKFFYAASILSVLGIEGLGYFYPLARLAYVATLPVIALGIRDVLQTRHAIQRNFPVIGHLRFLMESIRPEINQYFVESDMDGTPFNRVKRSNIYQRAKKELNTTPFGTKKNVYETGYEWINHSLSPQTPSAEVTRIQVGGPDCKQPYWASLFNISAMSYGSLSRSAILALNKGAKAGGFAHNTGEGGLSPYHLEGGGDVIWQIGTGYFCCRNIDGTFSEELFAQKSNIETVKMIEIKLSQGAKPGHGGILPKEKITPEIAEIRLVSMDEDVVSPPSHSAFSTPRGLVEFIARLRELSNGKPIGIKLCLGETYEFLAICKAMVESKTYPDFITIDGGEGGTGAAPLEFSDSVGTPLNDALVFIHNALTGFAIRDKIRIIVSGKITTGFDMISKIAMGADMCNSARGMMFALGCIQALQCHANTCPTGIATQDPELIKGLDVEHKWKRVQNFHAATLHSFLELLGAAGFTNPGELKPHHIQRRISSSEVRNLAQLYPSLEWGALLQNQIPAAFSEPMNRACPSSFSSITETKKTFILNTNLKLIPDTH